MIEIFFGVKILKNIGFFGEIDSNEVFFLYSQSGNIIDDYYDLENSRKLVLRVSISFLYGDTFNVFRLLVKKLEIKQQCVINLVK